MRAAVIPTMGREDLHDCVAAIAPQVHEIILICHNYQPPAEYADLHLIPYEKEIPNISEMWNLGLNLAQYLGAGRVAILNDDAVVDEDWFDRIETAMDKYDCVAGWVSGGDHESLVYRVAEPTLIRMTGYAFVVNHDLRADEQFQWWYGDNDLEWRCREMGGVVHVSGLVEHRHPNSTTIGRLREIADDDAKRFQKKWGRLP